MDLVRVVCDLGQVSRVFKCRINDNKLKRFKRIRVMWCGQNMRNWKWKSSENHRLELKIAGKSSAESDNGQACLKMKSTDEHRLLVLNLCCSAVLFARPFAFLALFCAARPTSHVHCTLCSARSTDCCRTDCPDPRNHFTWTRLRTVRIGKIQQVSSLHWST